MLLGTSDTIRIVLINIYAFLIDVNNGSSTNVGPFLIDSKNNDNNCEKNWEDYTLAMNCQRTIRRSANLFLVNNIYKHIGFIYLWLLCFITFIFTFARTTNSPTSIIHTSTNIFTISSSKKLAYAFLFFKGIICQYLNHLNYQQ